MVDIKDDDDDWKELVQDVDGFWNEETQETVQGRVVSITDMELAGRPAMVAILSLSKPCDAVTGSKKEKRTIKLDIGQNIGVVIKYKLSDMPSFLDNQNEVQITAKEKITLENSNTMWKYRIRFKGKRAGFGAALAKPAESSAPSSAGSSSKASSGKSDDATGDLKEF